MVAVGEKIACLSLDLEPDLWCPQRRTRLFESDERLLAFSSLLKKHDVPLTIFTVMKYARSYADRLRALSETLSTELAVHSYSHDTSNPATADEIARAVDEFGSLWNRRPQGYRAPNCLIDSDGLDRLAQAGFQYDSSLVPSLRLDGYGYNHLGVSTEPFNLRVPSGSIVELPIACVGSLRLPIIFSYVKLLGFNLYRAAANLFRLPNVLVTYLHPYDLYADEIVGNIPGWKRYAHARNGTRGFELLGNFIELLKARGYRFALMGDVAEAISLQDPIGRTAL